MSVDIESTLAVYDNRSTYKEQLIFFLRAVNENLENQKMGSSSSSSGTGVESKIEEAEEEMLMMMMGSYGGKVRVLKEGEESAAEEMMLLWGIQQPTFSKPNSFVSQSSLQLRLDACGHSLSILQSPSSLVTFIYLFEHSTANLLLLKFYS